MTFDVLIKHGEIVDGTGSPPRRADVATKDGRIVAVGNLMEAQGAKEIDASDKLITPGFIDAHAHSDVALYLNPVCETQIAQGITTEIMGNCGYSPFPLMDNNRGYLLEPPGVEVDWSTADEYFDRVSEAGLGINATPQVGHITVRAAVLDGEDRPATPSEIEQMKSHVRAAMEAGAQGLSAGLDYHPTTRSDLEEIVELCKVVAEYDGFYSSHVRGYSHNVLNAVAEAIEVGRRAGIRVQVSHIGVYGRQNWGCAPRLLYLMDKARREGTPVATDMMAYPTAGAWWAPRAVLPSSLYDWHKSWPENLAVIHETLQDPEARDRLASEIEANRKRPKHGFMEEFLIFSDWRDIYIKELPPGSPHENLLEMDLMTASEHEGMEPVDLYLDLLMEEGEQFGAIHSPISSNDFEEFLTDDWTMFGTDAIGSAIPRLSEPWNTIQPHRRHYGTFPRVLAKFVQEKGIIELGEAVRRMSALPAEHFRLKERGYIREGYWADLVVVDPHHVDEQATWREPSAYPVGIDHVFVNGVHAVADGEFTRKLGGQMLVRDA